MTKKLGGGICAVATILSLVYSQNAPLKTDKAGLELIANAEGCRTTPYYCQGGVKTVGLGSTGKVKNREYSTEEIAERFIKDVRQAERCVLDYAEGAYMTQGQFNATTSLVYNLGCTKLKTSTAFKLAHQHKFTEMCDQFPRWIYAAGKKNKGLIKRREKERSHCLNHK